MTNTQGFANITKILRCGHRYYAVCQPLTRINDEQRFLVVAAALRNPEEHIVLDVSLLDRPVVYIYQRGIHIQSLVCHRPNNNFYLVIVVQKSSSVTIF